MTQLFFNEFKARKSIYFCTYVFLRQSYVVDLLYVILDGCQTSLFLFQRKMLGLGELPKEYNKAVHGPYDPAIFYGKKDTPLSQV